MKGNLDGILSVVTLFLLVTALSSGQSISAQSGNEAGLVIQFSSPDSQAAPNSATINEYAARGTILGTVQVSGGASSGPRSSVHCSVSDSTFGLLAGQGPGRVYVVMLQGRIDREERAVYNLRVTCADINNIQAVLEITVNVEDVNDNAPFFYRGVYAFAVRENAPVGSVIGAVRAVDMDTGANGRLVYSFLPPGPYGITIDETSGLIRTSAPLDREATSEIQFSVVATDQGTPSHQGRTRVVIALQDVNDNTPVSLSPSYTFIVNRGFSAGEEIGRLNFVDRDTGENGRVTLTIQPPSDLFTTDGQALKATSTLDSLGTHNVTIVATDHGTPPLISAPVMVTVQVINTVN